MNNVTVDFFARVRDAGYLIFTLWGDCIRAEMLKDSFLLSC